MPAFNKHRNPLAAILISSTDDEDDDDVDMPLSPLARMAIEKEEEDDAEIGDGMAICNSPVRSVASIDSFAGQDDFCRFR